MQLQTERVAKFMVINRVNGEPHLPLDRGIYKEFPSDLDSGLPEYDIKRNLQTNLTLGTAGVKMGLVVEQELFNRFITIVQKRWH